MWIIPSNLFPYAQDMQGLTSESIELQAETLAQSLTVRGKCMQPKTFVRKLKKGKCTQRLSSRTLKPSLSQHFVEKWTSLLEDTHANPSVSQGNDSGEKTLDTFGRILQKEFEQQDLLYASSRTWKDTFRRASEKCRTAYDDWVIQLRLEYSQRQKLVRHTSEKGSSSLAWGTPNTLDSLPPGISKSHKESQKGRRSRSSNLRDQVNSPADRERNSPGLPCFVPMLEAGQQDQTNSNTHGKSQELNPRWVEQLMGLEVGWTSLGSWGTE